MHPCIRKVLPSSPFKRPPRQPLNSSPSPIEKNRKRGLTGTRLRKLATIHRVSRLFLRILRSCECNDKIERSNSNSDVYCVRNLQITKRGACTMTADTCKGRKRNHRNVITPFLERTMKYSSVPVLLPCTSLSFRGFCVWHAHRDTGTSKFEDRFCSCRGIYLYFRTINWLRNRALYISDINRY